MATKRDVTVGRAAARAAIRALEMTSRPGMGVYIEEFRRALNDRRRKDSGVTDGCDGVAERLSVVADRACVAGKEELSGRPAYVVGR